MPVARSLTGIWRHGFIPMPMEREAVSFEQLDREHCRARAEDARRLRAGEVTPSALQAENSVLPEDARVRVRDLIGYAKRNYLPG